MKQILWSLVFSVVTSSAFAMDCEQAQLSGHRLICETQYFYDLQNRPDLQNPAPQRILTVDFEAINEHESDEGSPECKASATVVDSVTGYKFNARSDAQKKISVTVYQGLQNEMVFSSGGFSNEEQTVFATLYLTNKNVYGSVPSKNGPVSVQLTSIQLSCRVQ